MDHLVSRGFRCLAVVDLSRSALQRSQARLPDAPVAWIEADVTGPWVTPPVDIWHDRAAFHFLTSAADRDAYRRRMLEAVRPGGCAIVATFAADGPERCSGLPVVRYSPDALAAALGAGFTLIESVPESHRTPGGATQAFWYTRFARRRT